MHSDQRRWEGPVSKPTAGRIERTGQSGPDRRMRASTGLPLLLFAFRVPVA